MPPFSSPMNLCSTHALTIPPMALYSPHLFDSSLWVKLEKPITGFGMGDGLQTSNVSISPIRMGRQSRSIAILVSVGKQVAEVLPALPTDQS
jgi:hypothetical protein